MSRVEMPMLDVMVCTTCELRCVGCTNHVGGIGRLELFPLADVLADVDRAAAVIHADLAVILGGEPLGHPHLVEIMRHTRESGLANRVRVLTNGIRLHKMKDAFWGELQDLKISVYPGKTPAENVELARVKSSLYGFDLSFYDVEGDPFRAVLTPEARSPESAQTTYDNCWYRSNTRKVERGFFYRCCTSSQISQSVLGLDPSVDGIALDGLTADALSEFLGRGAFMQSCTRCHGNMGPRIGWSEERDKTRWLDRSMVIA